VFRGRGGGQVFAFASYIDHGTSKRKEDHRSFPCELRAKSRKKHGLHNFTSSTIKTIAFAPRPYFRKFVLLPTRSIIASSSGFWLRETIISIRKKKKLSLDILQ